MATMIVTGAAGFIGSHLSRRLLASGHRVLGIDNFDRFYARSAKEQNLASIDGDFEFHEADILDAAAMRALAERERPEAIFHIAALAGVRPSIEDPARYAAVNVDGLVNMLESARHADCANFVFASSSSVYGNNKSVPFAESDDVAAPISPYAATKRAGELMCHSYAHLFGLKIAALRFFTVFGPAQRPDLAISKFMRLIAAEQPIPVFGDGTSSRDYTYVDDIVGGVVASCEKAQASAPGFCRIYNLGGSQPVTLSGMIEAIGAVVGKAPIIERLPMQPGDVDRTYADLTRATAELGFRPETDFETGLARQWAWIREHG